jgi:AcrR family transcriptional regulator
MGITERRERDRQEMRELILRHAIKLFLKKGFENVTIRNIAESMEYSPATIYLYFKDKDEILYALHTEGFQKLINMQQTIQGIEDPLERLRKHGQVYVRFALDNPEYYDLMFIMSATGRKIKEHQQEWKVGIDSYDLLRQNVQECMSKGLMHSGNVETASFALWSLVHGMASLIIRQRCLMIPESQLDGLVLDALAYVSSSLESNH